MGYILILSLLAMGSLVNQIQAQNKNITIYPQPEDQSTEIGQNVTFSIMATLTTENPSATPACFMFQWLKNGVMISDTPGKYSGIDTENLIVFFVGVSDEGVYSCNVSSVLYGNLLSREAVLRVARDCERLPNITNGVVTAPSLTPGSIATYTCSANYSLNGTANRTCEANGNWTQSAPNCIIRCERLPNITNGVVTAPSLTPGSIATYNCSANYSLNGTAVRTCEVNGKWTQSAPNCIIRCERLPNITNGVVTAPSLTPGSIATYNCSANYSLNGTAVRTCEVNGKWTQSAPNCIKNTAWKMAASGLLVTVIALVSILLSLSQ